MQQTLPINKHVLCIQSTGTVYQSTGTYCLCNQQTLLIQSAVNAYTINMHFLNNQHQLCKQLTGAICTCNMDCIYKKQALL